MIAIKEIMDRNFRKLSSLDSVESAVKAMEKIKSGYLLIEEKGRIKGVVTSHELAGYPSSRLILDCPIKPIAAISGKTLLDEALNVLKEKKTDFLVVINKQGAPIGAASQEIIISFLYQRLKKSNIEKEEYIAELKKAEKSLKEFSKGFEEKLKERTAELSILYEVSNAISYTLDFQTLLKLIMESLFKIVDYDICASLLFYANTANVTLRPAYPGSARFVDKVKNNLFDSTSVLTGETIREKRMSTFLIPSDPNAKPKENRQFDELRSFFNVPFVVRTKTVGMINVSSCRDNAFSEDDIKLIYTIANQASNAIERLQAVITAEKSKMESMVESMFEGVIMIDEQGEIVVFNPQSRYMLGFNLTEEVTFQQLIEKMKAVGLYDAFQDCQNEKKLITKDITVPWGGESVVLRCDIAPVKKAEGNVIGMLIILRDITRENEIDKMKTEFISNVSHELRTPLTSIREGVSQILEGLLGETTETQREFLSMCLEDIDRLARIINSLLNISRIESGKIELNKELLDISALCRNIIVSFSSLAKNKGLEFKGIIPEDKLEVYADKDKMVEVFTNLVGNALKFTHKGHIHLLVEEKEGMVECSVADTGCGVSKEDLPKLYGRFQQFGRVYGPGEKGTGLGLSIVKNIIELHNSEIRVESELNQGTKFTFSLPQYTPRELFREYVVNGIKEAVHRKESLSILVFYIENFTVVKEKLEDNRIAAIMNKLHEMIGSSLRRKGDISVKNTRAILTILPVTKREQADIIARRLEQTIGNYMSEEKLDGVIKMGCKTAGFPEDGNNADELFDKIRPAVG